MSIAGPRTIEAFFENLGDLLKGVRREDTKLNVRGCGCAGLSREQRILKLVTETEVEFDVDAQAYLVRRTMRDLQGCGKKAVEGLTLPAGPDAKPRQDKSLTYRVEDRNGMNDVIQASTQMVLSPDGELVELRVPQGLSRVVCDSRAELEALATGELDQLAAELEPHVPAKTLQALVNGEKVDVRETITNMFNVARPQSARSLTLKK